MGTQSLYRFVSSCLMVVVVAAGTAITPSASADDWQPIRMSDMPLYQRLLQLEDDQAALMEQLFETLYLKLYEDEVSSIHAAYQAIYRAASLEHARRLDDGPPLPEDRQRAIELSDEVEEVVRYRIEMQKMVSIREVWTMTFEQGFRVIEAIERIDQEFFEALEDVLPQSHHHRITLLRSWRARQMFDPSQHLLPEARVDLIGLLDTLSSHEGLTEAIDRQRLTEWTVEFHHRQSAELRRAYFARIDNRLRAMHLTDIMIFSRANPDLSPEEMIGRMPVYRGPGRTPYDDQGPLSRYELNTRLERINRQGLDSLMAVLPEEAMRTLTRAYHHAAYPEAYRDPADAEPLYRAALSIEGLDAAQRMSIEALLERYRARHFDMTDQLAESIRWRLLTQTQGTEGFQRAVTEGWRRQQAAGETRERLNIDQLAEIRRILDETQWDALPQWDFEEHPRARPWSRHPGERTIE